MLRIAGTSDGFPQTNSVTGTKADLAFKNLSSEGISASDVSQTKTATGTEFFFDLLSSSFAKLKVLSNNNENVIKVFNDVMIFSFFV